jgi:hypothetical protein
MRPLLAAGLTAPSEELCILQARRSRQLDEALHRARTTPDRLLLQAHLDRLDIPSASQRHGRR